jgi:hypothetical protein
MDNDLLKARVKGRVRFTRFVDNTLYYATDDGWVFPVPLEDANNSQGSSPTFLAEDKAMFFMRWIRNAMVAEEAYRTQRDTDGTA